MCSACGYDIEYPDCRNCGNVYEECDCGQYEPAAKEDLEEECQ